MSTFRALTSRRPFTLLGIVLALLVIGAFVLVALNAGTASNVPYQSVVVANADLKPRLPIDAASLAIKRIPVPANYPSVFFTKITDVQGMIPLVTILSGQAITSNVVVQASQETASLTIFTNLHVIRVGTNGSTGTSGASSLTVVVTQCQAEIITFFQQYSMKYSLESFHDYLSPDNQAKDPSCPTVDSAHGVTLQMIQKAYPTLF